MVPSAECWVLGRRIGWTTVVLALAASPHRPLAAQSRRGTALHEVAAAERAFALYADTANVPAAFLWALAPDAITLDGEGVHLMRPIYESRRPGPARLRWEPALVDASADGTMGITTGPWTWSPARDSAVQGRGQFLTIWKKGPERWQVALDLGISGDSTAQLTGALRELPAGRTGPARLDQLRELETDFIKGNGWMRHLRSLSTPDVRILRKGEVTVDRRDAIDGSPSVQFTTIGGTMAPSGDLGATWGTWRDGTATGSYVRIWKRTAKGWRVIIDRMGD